MELDLCDWPAVSVAYLKLRLGQARFACVKLGACAIRLKNGNGIGPAFFWRDCEELWWCRLEVHGLDVQVTLAALQKCAVPND